MARTVRIITQMEGAFFGGMILKSYVDLKGNNMFSDSYDSRDPNKSTNGRYDPAKRGDAGGLACVEGLVNSMSVGNADIFGPVWTGPLGTVAMKNNGVVGSLAWHADGNTGIEPGWWHNDLNIALSDVIVPNATWQPPLSSTSKDNKSLTTTSSESWTEPYDTRKNDGSTTVSYEDPLTGAVTNITTQIKSDGKKTTTTYTVTTEVNYTRIYEQVLENGDYTVGLLTKRTLVKGNARLYVTDRINITGSDFIELEPGATLKIYMAGSTAVIGTIYRPEGAQPTDFQYYGTPANTSLNIKGAPDWYGLVYAPSADLWMSGHATIYGSLVANSAILAGNATLHYDQALIMQLPYRGFIITSWDEL